MVIVILLEVACREIDASKVLKVELQLESLKPPKLELTFEFEFDKNLTSCSHSKPGLRVQRRPWCLPTKRQRGRKSEGNGPYFCTE